MKEKHFILLFFLTFATSFANRTSGMGMVYERETYNLTYFIQMNVYKNNTDKDNTGSNPSRTPIKPPVIGLYGKTLYLYGQFNDVTLKLLNNGTVEFSTAIPANANEVTLPDCTSGTYELQLNDGQYIYYCELEIE